MRNYDQFPAQYTGVFTQVWFLKIGTYSQKDYDFTREKIKEILSTKNVCNMDEFK